MGSKSHTEVVADYIDTSKAATDSAKSLAYASIAAIWVFKDHVIGNVTLPPILLISGFFLMFSLGLDLLQHLCSSSVALYWLDKARKANGDTLLADDAAIIVPNWYDSPSVIFYYCKIGSVLMGAIFLVATLLVVSLKL